MKKKQIYSIAIKSNHKLAFYLSKSALEKLIVESKMYERIVDPQILKKETSEALRRLEYIISKLEENLINVFRLDSEEGGADIELTILRAFLNCSYLKFHLKFKLFNFVNIKFIF